MADPETLSLAQERALTRARQEGRLYSHDGVSSSTIRRLEHNGLVRVTWSRRNVTARHHRDGWEVQTRKEWVAEPVIDDYIVFLRAQGREVRLTVYAALDPSDAARRACIRFWEIYCDGVETPVEVVKADPLSGAMMFFLS